MYLFTAKFDIFTQLFLLSKLLLPDLCPPKNSPHPTILSSAPTPAINNNRSLKKRKHNVLFIAQKIASSKSVLFIIVIRTISGFQSGQRMVIIAFPSFKAVRPFVITCWCFWRRFNPNRRIPFPGGQNCNLEEQI